MIHTCPSRPVITGCGGRREVSILQRRQASRETASGLETKLLWLLPSSWFIPSGRAGGVGHSFSLCSQSPVKGESSDDILDTKAVVAGDEEASFPPLKSEDSGIGLSASSPELSEHLRVPRVSADRDDIWKKDGSMQRTFLYIQELIANFASKNIFAASLTVSGEERKPEEPTEKSNKGQTPSVSHFGRKGSWDPKPITVPQFKQMLSDLFTARGSPFKTKSSESLSSVPSSPQRKAGTEWDIDQVVIELVGSKEDCREAFAAACHLLLDCATFPVYLSEEETEQLCETLFQTPGERAALPVRGEGRESCDVHQEGRQGELLVR